MTFGLAVGAVVVLAACAPADDDAGDTDGGSTGPPTSVPIESSAPGNQTPTSPAGVATETPSGGATEVPTGAAATTPTEVAVEPEAPTSVSGKPVDPDAVYGGVLETGYTREGPTFSTWEEAGGVAPQAVHPSHNMLVQNRTWGSQEDYNNLVFFELHPDLAASWEVSDDGLEWIFKIRDGVTWTDGTPFTCADAKWSYDTIRTGEGLNRSPRALAFNTVKADIDEGFVCADDLTLIANHDRPKAGFLEVMAMPYHVMRPAHIYDGNTDAMREDAPSIGTGPFTLAQWLPGESYTWEANDDYWDAPFPYLEGIHATQGTDASLDAAFRAGRLDIRVGVTGGRADTLLRECDQCVFFGRTVDSGFQALMTHHQRTPWNTPDIKNAIGYAMDRTRIGQIAADGWVAAPTAGPFYPGAAFDMPDDVLATIPGYNFADPEGNKDAARALLAEAGYEAGELTIPFTVWNISSIAATAVVIQEELESVGFEVEPILLETARAYQAWSDGDFDVGLHGFWVAGLDADIVLYEHFYTGSDRNYNRYSKVETDRLIDEMSATTDPELRKQRAWDVGEILLRDQAKHIIGNGSRIGGMQPNVGGYMYALNYLYGYGPFWRYDHTYLTD